MKIVQVIAGSGDSFYCENCLRDLAVVRAMRTRGHEVLALPLYLPPLGGGAAARQGLGPMFFGGINVWLQQKLALFRRTPRFIDRLLDARPLLRLASHRAGMTSAEDLAATTMSMLRGPLGRQAKELDRLVTYLREQERPDVVALSNALLLGLAAPLRDELGCHVVCFLQDEDEFVDALPEKLAGQVWAEMARHAGAVDAFVASSRYFADFMATKMSLAKDRMHVVYDAVEPPSEGGMAAVVRRHVPSTSVEAWRQTTAAMPPTIGFLSRFCPGKGLDLLAEAFVRLQKQEAFRDLRLRAAGGWTAADEPYLEQVRGILAAGGASDAAELLPNPRGEDRWRFLASLDVLSVPSRRPEAAGLCVLEALTVGVPVVQPDRGAMPELVEQTGGGLLFEAENVESLTATLARVLTDRTAARQLGQDGMQAVRERFSAAKAAEELERIYRSLDRATP